MGEFISQTELGEIYGVSSHKVGRWLKDLGLRTEDGRPSRDAINDGMVQQKPSTQPNTFFWCWHAERTCHVFDQMCYERAVTNETE